MGNIYKALTIAGSDSGGGAGIQADLKTFHALGVFGMSALTAVTAQNTVGVQGVYPLSVEAVEKQIESIGTDLGTDAVKTGMLFSAEIIEAVANQVKHFRWSRLVVDPVMIAKGGEPLLQEEAVNALKKYLLPLAMVITPNIPEAEALTGMFIQTMDDRQKAAQRLYELGVKHVVIKGGHDDDGDEAVDLLFDGQEYSFFTNKRIETKHTHGTGCTFAAAITAELAKGKRVKDAVQTAKAFIQAAIEHELGIGHGHGPTNHWAYQQTQLS
ncbi:bifunctional hydroxymethylpyrimidine kinase/phosphomethylpyrimidine kinase [Bacillus alveayuensis]|jgi:hydroxymethylpyrimidine/phosphomethylpyrimidine kinase|uniref:Hydroxymethylpyrimidine/phosphomethylpyrimidine kinase n=1 Tax=Aeribacillus alveayuensis TaxID=279215 RepID=A0ABT9VPP6_9BACI|nr:bifunctional hydroxymethylpyrimidine kinase/phosphomethylpyrimidine kinase [Bacillus alveayuensis]MDQ0162952.1 hydroxymethylpyrimidine/phosphomethylpyrimidine kinase [Bacillus alveayuensis]